MILHILDAEITGPTSLTVRFNDGCSATIDLRPLFTGKMFEPLLDPNEFAKFTLDPVCQAICWPIGADLAPEAIHRLQRLAEVCTLASRSRDYAWTQAGSKRMDNETTSR